MALTLATFAAVGAVCLALRDSSAKDGPSPWFGVGVPILAVLLAWLLVHTLYAFDYARRYYDPDDDRDDGSPGRGLDFHEDALPDYRDFLYVAFSVACTFGLTDVEVNCKPFRRAITQHTILSFAFATIVIALAVNVITNLLSGG